MVLSGEVERSDMCKETQLIAIVPEMGKSRISGHACSDWFYIAEMNVTAHISATDSRIVFDEEEYLKKRQKINDSFLRLGDVISTLFLEEWHLYLPITKGTRTSLAKNTCQHVATLLLATYDFDFAAMANNNTMTSRAGKIMQEIFAETVQHSLQQNASTDSVSGKVTKIESRIIATAGVAIALASFLCISLSLQVVVWSLSRNRVRPLHLMEDPATTTGIAALIDVGSQTHMNLRKLKHHSHTLVNSTLGEKEYYTTHNNLHEFDCAAEVLEGM